MSKQKKLDPIDFEDTSKIKGFCDNMFEPDKQYKRIFRLH